MSSRARDEGEAEAEGDQATRESLESLDDAMLRPPRRPLRRSGSSVTASGSEGGDAESLGGAQQTSRLLEALEALSGETGGAMPPSLRSLLGQLQGDDTAMAGLMPFMQMLESHGSHPRFHRMLQSIDADAPPHVQMSGLSDLCESLSMSSEESLVVSGFSVDKFLPPVIQLIRAPPTMEVLLLAARALSSIFDLFPTVAIPKAMSDGSSLVDAICAKLLEIEYMDVAELAFQILERIVFCPQSESGPTDFRRFVIAANGFVALLQFVDFFPIEIQRTAAHVVAGLCANITIDSLDALQIAFPLIAGLLRSSDSEIVLQGCKSFQSLSTSPAFATCEGFAHLVASEDTCDSLVQLIESFASRKGGNGDPVHSSSLLSVKSCVSVLQYMSAVLSAHHAGMRGQTKQLRLSRLPPIVAELLAMHTVVDDVQWLRETLKLVIAILPPHQSFEEDGPDSNCNNTIRTFLRAVLPSVINVYEVSARREVRHDCLGVVLRGCLLKQHIEHTEDDISELAHLSSFLARVLRPDCVAGSSSKAESRNSCVALQIAQACLHSGSTSSIHAKSLFERHGVSAAIRWYASADEADQAEGVGALSKLLISKYIGKEDASSEPSLEKLRDIVRQLEAFDESSDRGGDHSASLSRGLRQLLELSRERRQTSRSADGWLTAHEISASGLSRSLNRVLHDTNGRRAFGDIFVDKAGDSDATIFLDGLIVSVHDAISAEKEAFRVDLCVAGSPFPVSTGSVTRDMDQLTQHIKVRVKIDDGEHAAANVEVKRNKRSVHDTVVLVEPLARIDTIEEFIAERLFGSRSPFGALHEEEDELLGRGGHREGRRESVGEEKDGDGDDEATADDQEDDHDDENDDLRSDRPLKQKRLQVLFGGVVMPGDSSVLEAILKHTTTPAADSGSTELAKVWSGSPHEFVFQVLGKDKGRLHDACAGETETGSTVTDPQIEALVQPELVEDVWDLLGILKYLYELCGDSKSTQFVNSYVNLQVSRALTQPVRVMTNFLPPWSRRIVEDYPFVLDYDTRFDYMFATTSGAPRAISYLCRTLWKKAALAEEPQAGSTSGRETGRLSRRTGRDRTGGSSTARSATAALTNLSRMAKLPRLKVRVARSRLLQSAMKLFSMYGGKKAIIEIEFLGEVGTGLGPTTEFYTLVCHELQASYLKLWRNDKDVSLDEQTDEGNSVGNTKNKKKKQAGDKTKKPGLPVRGYHRVAVYHCTSCKHLEVPRCAIHDQLLTCEKPESNDDEEASGPSIPQCAKCLDSRDWHSTYSSCKACRSGHSKDESAIKSDLAPPGDEDGIESPANSPAVSTKKSCTLKWWILSEEEALYLRKVYPRDVESIKHPVLQCSHCDTVNFPGTDAGIVVLDHSGERMMSRAGRRMYERDYRAVTKHVSPLCEGTPLKQIGVELTREAVDTLVDCIKKSPELLDTDVESLCYLSEVAIQGEVEVVDAPFGLFPKPCNPRVSTASEKPPLSHGVLSWFNFMGCFVAQAILDERLVNLPLSLAFLRALRGETLVGPNVELSRSLDVVREVDPAIAQSLSYLQALATDAAEETHTSVLESKASLVDSMCLSFTLVGDGSIALCDDGKNRAVTLANLSEYVRLNVQFLLDETIKQQVAAFYKGFKSISGCADARTFLRSFSLAELEFLLADKCLSGDSMWGRDGKELREHMVCDHGYSPQSRAIHDLVAILCELPLDDQRLFVKFVTGANRLPLGGLAKLEPKLTVVRKLATSGDGNELADAVLPSASTCTNYLKLPEYSTRETMKRRLLYCIHEGQGSFHLS